ncbi:hypothetical protein OG912_25135 [Streptomyces sp. NBC_00464]|uniref:hypothetical protein n=1 Tax=Streptomyces sp. NBC_00464 TaxID=2975751 RepID=UPI002E19133D
MRERKRRRWGVPGGVAALTFSILTATPALADESVEGLQQVSIPAGAEIVEGTAAEPPRVGLSKAAPSSSACLGPVAAYGVQGCFQHYGDTIWSGDTVADGMSAAVGVYTDYGRASFVCINKQGAGSWATCKKDYWEEGDVQLRALRYDGDTGKFYQPEARSGWIPVDGQF